MANIERKAELCPDRGGLQPCPNCGSTAAIIEIFENAPTRIRRLCCGLDPWWLSPAGRDWFALVNAASQSEAHHG
jgi:hypothetical protein